MDQNYLRVSNRDAAPFYSVTTYTDKTKTAGKKEIFYKSGKKESEGQFTVERQRRNPDIIKEEGVHSYYYENGQLRNQVTYSNNKMEGQNTHWLLNGKVLRMGKYLLGLPDGEAFTYHPDGKVKRKEVFKNGLLQEGKCFTKTGADTVFYAFEERAEFAGGEEGLSEFLKQNVTYPKMALRNGIEGMVVVQFVVTTTGEIVGTEVVKKVGFGLDEESLRMVNLMKGKFKPARLDGTPITFRYSLPVTFNLR